MDAVCEECGHAGFRHLLLHCSKCKNAVRHRYCLDAIIFDLVVEWSCSGCMPKHNGAIKSLEDTSNQRQLSNTQLGCSMIDEPTMNSEKITWARGRRTIRPHQKRKYHVDEITKPFPSGDTSGGGQRTNKPHKERSSDAATSQFCSGDALDPCEVFVGDITNCNDCEKEGEDRNGHLTCAVESSDGSRNSPLDHPLEFKPNNLQKAIDGSKLASNSAECTDLSNVRSGCFASSKYVEGLVPRGRKGDIFSVTNDVEGSLPMTMVKSSPAWASGQADGLFLNLAISEPMKAVKGLENSAVALKFAPYRSKRIQGSVLKTESADVLSPLKPCLDSCSMVPVQSSPSNELEDAAVQENSAERTRCLMDEHTNAPTMENLKVSNPSMENECLVSNEGYSDKENRRSDEVLLSTKAKMPRRTSGDRDIFNSFKENGISNPEPAKGDQDARKLQRSAGKQSSLDVKKVFLKQVLQEEGINNELLSSKFVGPCESTKINPRKRKQLESYTPGGTKYQKVARSKGGRPAPVASLRDSQNMPGEDSGSNNKVTGHSKNGKHKKMDKSCLANKASRDPRKRCTVRSVLQPSFLHTSSVEKSKACSENMDALESDVSPLALQTVVKEGYCGISRMPLISECIDTQPLDKPYWTGIMKIDKNYIPLTAHLSTKACKKVQKKSRSLPPIIKVNYIPLSKTCPKHLEAPIPLADNIGLYFFSSDTRPNKELDQLVKHVADSGIILEAIVGLSKLFLFSSSVLPDKYQMFHGKPFLWGMFKPRNYVIKKLAPVEQDCTAHTTKEDHVQEKHVLDQQNKAQGDTLDQVVYSNDQPLLDANANRVGTEALSGNGLPLVDMKATVSANISPADHGQPCSKPEAPPLKLCGFVLSRTPRSVELIQEMQKEGAVLFAVQQVMAEPGSVV